EGSRFRVQWHRFEDESPLHPLIKTLPHVAFKVSDLNGALEERRILLQPHSPFPGYRVAMIEDGGVPVEFVETTLSDEEIWSLARRQSDMYPERSRTGRLSRDHLALTTKGLLLPNGAPRSTALYAVPPTGTCHRNRKKR